MGFHSVTPIRLVPLKICPSIIQYIFRAKLRGLLQIFFKKFFKPLQTTLNTFFHRHKCAVIRFCNFSNAHTEKIVCINPFVLFLYKGLATLSEKQYKRIYAHYFLGMSIAEIAKADNCAFMSVKESVERGLKRLEKFFEENL